MSLLLLDICLTEYVCLYRACQFPALAVVSEAVRTQVGYTYYEYTITSATICILTTKLIMYIYYCMEYAVYLACVSAAPHWWSTPLQP